MKFYYYIILSTIIKMLLWSLLTIITITLTIKFNNHIIIFNFKINFKATTTTKCDLHKRDFDDPWLLYGVLYSNMHEPELGCCIRWACARELFINTVQIVGAKIAWIIGSTAKSWYNILEASNIFTLALDSFSYAPHLSTLVHAYNAHIATHSTNTNFIYKRTLKSCVHNRINLRCGNLKRKVRIIISWEVLTWILTALQSRSNSFRFRWDH